MNVLVCFMCILYLIVFVMYSRDGGAIAIALYPGILLFTALVLVIKS